MDDNNTGLVIELLIVVGLLVVGSGVDYLYCKHKFFMAGVQAGRIEERDNLTQALSSQIEAVYYDGRADAERDCRDGFIK